MTIHIRAGIRIRTTHEFPPIPVRELDWSAINDDTYDGEGCAIGTGATEEEAIEDLLYQCGESESAAPWANDEEYTRGSGLEACWDHERDARKHG